MNLAYNYPIIFWDTANLIVDSGAMNLDQEIDLNNEEEIENTSCDYGKIASSIGKMKSRNLKFSLPDINKSDITFSPDLQTGTILYGLRGINRIGNQLIKDIIKNRPYTSMQDFLDKININKVQMVSLIKAGIFDCFFKTREQAMTSYLNLITDKKKRITLQNLQMLIDKNLIPAEFSFEKRLFNFNKYIKKSKKKDYYELDEIALNFFSKNYGEEKLDSLSVKNKKSYGKIQVKTWDSLYKKDIEPIREWMKENQEKILKQLNNELFQEEKEKYAGGTVSKWEMDSLSFYYHDHELQKLRKDIYGISNYFDLPDEPEIEREFESKNGNKISVYKLSRIAGTIIDKDKNKSTITLLTCEGVVLVKVWKSQFATWDKQISQTENGKKKVIEKSWFTRGNKIIITGMKRENTFVPKKYKNTPYPLFERIDEMDERGFITKSATERIEEV